MILWTTTTTNGLGWADSSKSKMERTVLIKFYSNFHLFKDILPKVIFELKFIHKISFLFSYSFTSNFQNRIFEFKIPNLTYDQSQCLSIIRQIQNVFAAKFHWLDWILMLHSCYESNKFQFKSEQVIKNPCSFKKVVHRFNISRALNVQSESGL